MLFVVFANYHWMPVHSVRFDRLTVWPFVRQSLCWRPWRRLVNSKTFSFSMILSRACDNFHRMMMVSLVLLRPDVFLKNKKNRLTNCRQMRSNFYRESYIVVYGWKGISWP